VWKENKKIDVDKRYRRFHTKIFNSLFQNFIFEAEKALVKKLTAILMFAMLLMSMFPFTPTIKPAKAWSGIVYIRADGSIDPSTAPIKRDGRTYTFTADIYGSIVVETNNIMIDGAGYVLKGIGNGTGIDLSGRNRITIKNVNIENFYYGILLGCSSFQRLLFHGFPLLKTLFHQIRYKIMCMASSSLVHQITLFFPIK
jgi:hypothetical protein